MSEMTFWEVPGTFTNPSALPDMTVLDPLLTGASGGIDFLFDLAYTGSWAKQAAPANGDPVVDIAANGTGPGSVVVSSANAPTFAGGGFDFSPTETAVPNEILAPSGVLSTIQSAQRFLVVSYVKLPTLANLPNNNGLSPLFESTGVVGGYTAAADLVTIALQGDGTNPTNLVARRQTNGSTNDALVMPVSTLNSNGLLGTVCQVAYWRNASGTALRVRNASSTQLITGSAGSLNAGTFSAQRPRWGRSRAFTPLNVGKTGLRVYRGWVADLSVDTRDPATVLDADWARVVSRFS